MEQQNDEFDFKPSRIPSVEIPIGNGYCTLVPAYEADLLLAVRGVVFYPPLSKLFGGSRQDDKEGNCNDDSGRSGIAVYPIGAVGSFVRDPESGLYRESDSRNQPLLREDP